MKKFVSLVTIIVFLLSVWVILKTSLTPGDGGYYLLSALTTALAAIFGITFFLSLAVIQLTTSYSPKILFFNKVFWVISLLYMLGFTVIILAALNWIKYPRPVVINALLIGSSLLVLLLPLYFIKLMEEISPEVVLKRIRDRAITRIKKGKEALADVRAMHNVVMSGFIRHDYDVIRQGVETLLQVIKEACPKNKNAIFNKLKYRDKWLLLAGSDLGDSIPIMENAESTMIEAFLKLVHICTVPRDDPYVPIAALSKINNCFRTYLMRTFSLEEYRMIQMFIISETVIALLSAERKCSDTIWWVLDYFRNLPSLNPPSQNADEYNNLCCDCFTSLLITLESVKTHLPGFEGMVKLITDQLQNKFEDAICKDGKESAKVFNEDVFPDIGKGL